jgi:hypothetical protein
MLATAHTHSDGQVWAKHVVTRYMTTAVVVVVVAAIVVVVVVVVVAVVVAVAVVVVVVEVKFTTWHLIGGTR